MIEVKLNQDYPMSVAIETLKRIGVANRETKIIYPTAYIIEIDGRFYISHFKEMFQLTRGNMAELSESDMGRLNSVVICMKRWGIVTESLDDVSSPTEFVFVLKKEVMDRDKWSVSHKFNMLEFKIWKEGRKSEN
jgi:hypothetical protein